jgi:hypothetical protein
MPPEAPISPLAQAKAQLDSPSLDLDTQLKLMYQLRQFLSEPDKAAGARQLLQQLRQHPDVRASIAQDIAVLLGDSAPPMPVTRPPEARQQQPTYDAFPDFDEPARRTVTVGKAASGGLTSFPKPVIIGMILGFLYAAYNCYTVIEAVNYLNYLNTYTPGYVAQEEIIGTYIGAALAFLLWPGLGWLAGKLFVRFFGAKS